MKVKYYPSQPHCFAFGGFDIQMINTLESVIKAGVEASKLDIWSRDNDFDIIHLWGVSPHNFQIIEFAKKGGKKIIATVLAPYHDTPRSKLGYYYRSFFHVKNLKYYYKLIDKIIVLNDLQLKVLTKYYKVPPSKMEIIPNIIEDKFFELPELNFSEKHGIDNYVLCCGNICPRKNQYNLAQACVNLNVNLVLVGNILDGESSYGEKIASLVERNKNLIWIKGLPNASEELVSAYYHCTIYGLLSKDETQPISALEAVAVQKPLILMDRAYAHDAFFKDATLCKSPSVKDIEIALKEGISKKEFVKENFDIKYCTEKNVGELYKNCYMRLV